MTTPYRPSNGSEGLMLQHRFCNRCIHDKPARNDDYDNACPIFGAALIFMGDDPEYPVELVRDGVLDGRCTAFEQDPDEPVYDPDAPRGFPLPSEVMGGVLGGFLAGHIEGEPT